MLKEIKNIIKAVVDPVRVAVFSNKWQKQNKENKTYPVCLFPANKVVVGKGTYGPLKIQTFSNDEEKLIIGNYVSIADKVTFILGGCHNYKFFSTYPFPQIMKNVCSFTDGHIVIDDDVWIGYGATILSGVSIGKGSVIGAKSVVAKNVPPYSVFIGNRIVGRRFDEKIIEKLNEVEFMSLDETNIAEICDIEITEENIDEVIHVLNRGGIK